MLLDTKSENTDTIMEDRLKSIEERLTKMDLLLQQVYNAILGRTTREPTPAEFHQMDTCDENSVSMSGNPEKKEIPTANSVASEKRQPASALQAQTNYPQKPKSLRYQLEPRRPRVQEDQPAKLEKSLQRASPPEYRKGLPAKPKHFGYLEKKFINTFGLPIETGRMCTISSFDGVALAAGYEKVVITWQGMYFRLRAQDIFWGNLNRRDNPGSKVITWST